MPLSLIARPSRRSRLFPVVLMALSLAGCDDASETSTLTPAPQDEGGSVYAEMTWLDTGSPISPAQWLASRAAKTELPQNDPRVEATRKELGLAAHRFGDEPRMIANRAVQVENMLAEQGIHENASDIIAALVPIAAKPGALQGFGTLCQQYFILRQQGFDRDDAVERLGGLSLHMLGSDRHHASILNAIWYDRTIRIQLMIVIGVINIIALAVIGIIFVANAREATKVEMEASVELAKNFVRVAIQSLSPDVRPADLSKKVNQLSSRLRIGKLRHVRIYMADASGDLVQLSPAPNTSRAPDLPPPAPHWFEALIAPEVAPQTVNVVLSNRIAGSVVMIEMPAIDGPRIWDLGTVVIAGEPSDEIAEVWADLSSLGPVVGVIDLLVLATLYVVLGRLLDPMANVAGGLSRLEDGDYGTRLTPPRVKELSDMTSSFNRLAETLGRTRAENGRLYGQVLTIQEDERREIANELHDEASPCLFGIMANAMSAQRLAKEQRGAPAAEIDEHMTEILTITNRLKQMNRVMLKKLRPVAVGHVALSKLARDLISEMQRRYVDVDITCSLRTRGERYGEAIDLTIYRCIQEGVTNAIRHGGASAIRVDLFDKRLKRGARVLQLLIQDDGRGLSPNTPLGFGLTAMRERVRALSGSWDIQSVSSKGTLLEIVIPITAARAKARASAPATFEDIEVS